FVSILFAAFDKTAVVFLLCILNQLKNFLGVLYVHFEVWSGGAPGHQTDFSAMEQTSDRTRCHFFCNDVVEFRTLYFLKRKPALNGDRVLIKHIMKVLKRNSKKISMAFP